MEENKAAKILLVEDDPTMRTVLRTLLEIEGFTVATMPDRKPEEEIISIIKTEKPQIMLLDVHLKQINGISVLRRMRADPELGTVRVVMTSGMDMKDQCIQAGADDFIMKPYMPDELLRKLKL